MASEEGGEDEKRSRVALMEEGVGDLVDARASWRASSCAEGT